MRNLNVEHLDQVKEAVLEIDGTLSILFYPDVDVKYGLSLFPSSYKSIGLADSNGPYACMYCEYIVVNIKQDSIERSMS